MGAPLKVIDLFAGVGGISLGAARAGFQVTAAVELDKLAVEYHSKNFPNTLHFNEDISVLSGTKLLEQSNLRMGELDGLVGGPPCQGFSDIGLKNANDPRNELLSHFFRLVSETDPAFFIAENVPGLVKERNKIHLENALSHVPNKYKILEPLVLRASDYGAPTLRTRVFFIGYDPSRINQLSKEDFLPKTQLDTRVGSALEGLPPVRSTWQKEEQSWRSVGMLPDSFYSRKITSCIPPNVGDPEALNLYKQKQVVSGFLGTIHTPETIKRFNVLKPGAVDRISKCVRLNRDSYCPTLRAGTGADRGGFQAIRPVHPTSPRVITPREAARLQGFPDWYQFHPTKWHSFRQIGNSVSPIVSEAVLSVIYHSMT